MGSNEHMRKMKGQRCGYVSDNTVRQLKIRTNKLPIIVNGLKKTDATIQPHGIIDKRKQT